MTSGIHVNFSDQEASSEARDFTPLPSAKYHVKISDGSLEEISDTGNAKPENYGKNYWNLELTVQDGPYEGRRLFDNVMLFDGALYSLSQLMKALGYDIDSGDFEVPELDDILGEDLVVGAQKKIDKYRMEREDSDEKLYKTEVRNYRRWTGEESEAAAAPTQPAATRGGESNLLP